MRKLTPNEDSLWRRVVKSVTPLGHARRPSFNSYLQLFNPLPSWVLDLHGYTVYDAFKRTKEMVDDAYMANVKEITVITGKSGEISREFPLWLDKSKVRTYELLNGGGSYRVFLKKKPQKTVS